MSIDRDLAWANQERPTAIQLDPATTARVRADLVDHITASARAPRGERHGRRKLARIALPIGAAAAAAVVLTVTGMPSLSSSGPEPGTTASHLVLGGVPSAEAAPLDHLSRRLAATAPTAPLTGDATLIERHMSYPDRPSHDAVDLYTDAGRAYTADSVAGLPAQIEAEDADTNPADDWDSIHRDVQAATAALSGTIEAARNRMAHAAELPGSAPSRSAGEQKKGTSTVDATTSFENSIWSNCMDALSAGASDPKVRAGVLHLLASIDRVTVARTTLDGRAALRLTSTVFPDGYTEVLTVDASTGMPIRFVGAQNGTPQVTVTYAVARTTLGRFSR